MSRFRHSRKKTKLHEQPTVSLVCKQGQTQTAEQRPDTFRLGSLSLKERGKRKTEELQQNSVDPSKLQVSWRLITNRFFRRTHCRGRIIGQQRYKCMNLSFCCVDIAGKNQSATSARRHLCTCDANLPQSHSADLCLPPAQSSAARELGRSHSAKAAWSCFPTA